MCKEFGTFSVKRRIVIIAEMDKGKEILLAFARTYIYPVVIQIIDGVKRLCDKLGYLGEFSLFERYSLLVLVDKAFGENVFLLMILIIRVVVKKCYV